MQERREEKPEINPALRDMSPRRPFRHGDTRKKFELDMERIIAKYSMPIQDDTAFDLSALGSACKRRRSEPEESEADADYPTSVLSGPSESEVPSDGSEASDVETGRWPSAESLALSQTLTSVKQRLLVARAQQTQDRRQRTARRSISVEREEREEDEEDTSISHSPIQPAPSKRRRRRSPPSSPSGGPPPPPSAPHAEDALAHALISSLVPLPSSALSAWLSDRVSVFPLWHALTAHLPRLPDGPFRSLLPDALQPHPDTHIHFSTLFSPPTMCTAPTQTRPQCTAPLFPLVDASIGPLLSVFPFHVSTAAVSTFPACSQHASRPLFSDGPCLQCIIAAPS